MLRLFLYLIAGAVIIIFASQNLEMVSVYLIAGTPIEAPLIVVVGISFFAGFVFAILAVIRKAIRGNQKRTGTSVMNSRRGM